MAGPREYVSAPSFTPLPYGLLSALGDVIRTPRDGHWQGGVTYETLCGDAGTTYDECLTVSGSGGSTPPEPPAKTETSSIGRRGATPFTVYARVDCSAPGFWDRAEELGARALAEGEEYQVERAFWTGVAGGGEVVHPHLAADAELLDDNGIVLQTAATSLVGGGTLDVVEALGRLEKALADCYQGVGVIHVPRSLNAAMQSELLIIKDGPRYRTANGNIVVFGSGYTGSSPSGATADSLAWIYGTGMPFIYRSPVRVMRASESIDRATNTVYALAERTYVIGWDCCHIGTNVTLGGVPSGASGEPT